MEIFFYSINVLWGTNSLVICGLDWSAGIPKNQRESLHFCFQCFGLLMFFVLLVGLVGLFWFCVCVWFWFCFCFCETRMLSVAPCAISDYGKLTQGWDAVQRVLGWVHWKICAACAPARQKSQGFVSLKIAKTCAIKSINVSQFHRKLGCHEYLCITVLAVLYYETSEIKKKHVILSLVLGRCCVWQIDKMWNGGSLCLLCQFLCKHLEIFRDRA